MGFVLIAIYTGSQLAYQGAVIQMIAHGLSAAGLFILCGQLYERIHTRDMRMMGGLWSKMKWLPALSLFFAVATLGMPEMCIRDRPWSVKILRALERGEGQPGDIETLEQLCRFLGPGKTFCAHAPGAVEPLPVSYTHLS